MQLFVFVETFKCFHDAGVCQAAIASARDLGVRDIGAANAGAANAGGTARAPDASN